LISSEKALRRRLERGEKENELCKQTLKTLRAMVENAEMLARGEDTKRVRSEMIEVLDMSRDRGGSSEKTTEQDKSKKQIPVFPVQFSKIRPDYVTVGLRHDGELEPLRLNVRRESVNVEISSIMVSVLHDRWTAQCVSCDDPHNPQVVNLMVTLRSLDIVPNLSEVLNLELFACVSDGRTQGIGIVRVEFCDKSTASSSNSISPLLLNRLPIVIYRETNDRKVFIPNVCVNFLNVTTRSKDSIECTILASSRYELALRFQTLKHCIERNGLRVDMNKACDVNVATLCKLKLMFENDRTCADEAVATLLRSLRRESSMFDTTNK